MSKKNTAREGLDKMVKIPLENPSPDFESLEKVLKGEKEPQRVYFIELRVDEEVIKYIVENVMNREWIPPTEETREDYQKQIIDFHYRMGEHFIRTGAGWKNLPEFKGRSTTDTAVLSRGERSWAEEGGGIIKNWEDFEKIDWDNVEYDLQTLDYLQKKLPDGMKMTVGTILFEMVFEYFFGYEDLFILSHDNPELVEAVFEQWGQKIYEYYKQAVQHPGVGAIFHADDLGHKTATMLSPDFLRKNVFPWFKKYASLAHEQGKTYWLHSCGNLLEVMEDLIEDVKLDALHSFQDVIIPVGEFMKRYGDRVAALGGIDVDNLGRMSEPELRAYVRNTLGECMPGRYALGSGNSVANYVSPQNYLAMLDEGLKWHKK